MCTIAGMARSYTEFRRAASVRFGFQTSPARRFSSMRSPWARISPPAR